MVIPVDFDEGLALTVDVANLPENWQTHEGLAYTQALGDAWIARRASALLAVPSRIVPIERNYLLNPEHPDMGLVRLGEPQPFTFDPRLTRLPEVGSRTEDGVDP